MFINTNSIIVNGVSLGQYLVEAKYQYNKLWTNAGRSLSGSMTATLIGIFPKIVLTFRKLTKAELEVIVPILDAARQTTTYYDPNKKQNVTMSTYTGDYEIVNKQIINGTAKNDGFTCSLIAIKKRV